MSTSALLLIALASVVLLLLLVIKAKSTSFCGAPDRQSAGGIRHRHSGR